MSITPPLGFTRWTRYTDDSFAVGEQLALHVGRLHRPQERVPVLFFHDYQHDARTTLDGAFDGVFSAHTSTSYPLIAAELGGTSQWATPDVVDTGGYVDDAIEWAHDQVWIATGEVKVAILAFGMGTLNALNWAWRHPGKVRSMVLVGPIVDADAFYTSNPSLQAAINADWGSGAAWTAALPDIDPMQNLGLVRPFGHKIQLWYGDADTQIAAADVQAFAELVGAEAHEFVGTEAQRHLVPADRIAVFTMATIRDRDRVHLGWDDTDWGRFDHVVITQPADPADRNVNELRTAVWPGGRRGEFHRISDDANGNERHGYLSRELSAPDMSVRSVWFQENGGTICGQHGNIVRGTIDEDAGTYNFPMCWSDIFGFMPWLVNRAVWAGTVDGNDLVLLGLQNSEIAGLRLSAGGEILASERSGGVVTLVVHADDLDRSFRSGTLSIKMAGPLGDHVIGTAVRTDANHVQYPLAGADVTSGGPGSWADFASCYPFHADTELVGTEMRGRFYPIGMDPPAWGDPDWGFNWSDTGPWATTGYGKPGILLAHVGAFTPTRQRFIQVGETWFDEM